MFDIKIRCKSVETDCKSGGYMLHKISDATTLEFRKIGSEDKSRILGFIINDENKKMIQELTFDYIAKKRDFLQLTENLVNLDVEIRSEGSFSCSYEDGETVVEMRGVYEIFFDYNDNVILYNILKNLFDGDVDSLIELVEYSMEEEA